MSERIRRTANGFGRVAFSIVLIGLVTVCGQAPEGEPADSNSRNNSRRSRKAKTPDVKESVDLAGLLTEIPEYSGSGRNLFDYGPPPVGDTPPRPTPRPTPPTPTRTTRPAPPRTPTPARINLKFTGFVETRTQSGEKKKYAVFLDGQEILTGAEGDLVANRYEIVQIGLESVTVGVRGSDQTQRIPLRSN